MANELTETAMERLRVPVPADIDPTGLWMEYAHPRSGLGRMLCVGIEGVERDGARWLLVAPAGSVRETSATVSSADDATAYRLAAWAAVRNGRTVHNGLWFHFSLWEPQDEPSFIIETPDEEPIRWPLVELDYADDRRLTSGARWVDRAALAEVVRHLGGARG